MQEIEIKIIKVSKKAREELLQEFGCGKTTIYNSLAFRTYSPISDKIRKAALAKGGVLTDKTRVIWTE